MNIIFPPEGTTDAMGETAIIHVEPRCDAKLIVDLDELQSAWREKRDAHNVVRIAEEAKP